LNVSDEALHLQVYMKNCMIKPNASWTASNPKIIKLKTMLCPNGYYKYPQQYPLIIYYLKTHNTVKYIKTEKIFVN